MTPVEARALLASSGADSARDAIRTAIESANGSLGNHLEWARICEEAGLLPLAFRELLKAAQEKPDDPAVLLALAEAHRERGEADRALALLERAAALQPAAPEVLRELVGACREAGKPARAEEAIARARAAGLDDATAQALAARPAAPAPLDEDLRAPEDTQLPSDDDIARFLALFRGREDVYARQWHDPGGEGGYSPVHQPLTPAVAKNHVLGNITVGIYPVRLDATVAFFALDLDIERRALEAARADRDEARPLRAAVAREGVRLAAVLRDLGFAPLLEDSGYKGRHLWVFLAEPAPAALVCDLGRLLLAREQALLAPSLHLEFFPRQAQRGGKGLGNLIKLPLGIHRRSGRPSRLLDEAGRPIADPFAALRAIGRADLCQLERAIATLRADPRTAAAAAAAAAGPVAAPPAGPAPAPPAPPPVWTEADFEADPAVRQLLANCPVLAEIRRKVDEHRRLTYDEQMVLVHALGHVPAGTLAVNYLLSRCADVAPETFLKSTLGGNPISCPKIRKRVPHVAGKVDCSCVFPFAPDRYPTPLLHLLAAPPPAAPPPAAPPPAAPAGPDAETIARRFALLLRREDELRREIELARAALLAHLEAAADRALACDGGRYVLREVEGRREIVWEPAAQSEPPCEPSC
jgi:tetratricopeptide (TPR) repeat protein